MQINKYEDKFWKILNEMFIGEKIEGKSGYINLMKIKSDYFNNYFKPNLKKFIEKQKITKEFKEELYSKLYTFFHRYFSESGSIYLSYTPLYYNIYEKVYNDDNIQWQKEITYDHNYERIISDKEDVTIFWKTQMLYYIKTDMLIKSLEIEINNKKMFFDASEIEHKINNEKKELIFEFHKIQENKLILKVFYSERNKKTNIDEILRQCKIHNFNLNKEEIIKAINIFNKQSKTDYFINKNVEKFLKEHFNLWMYQYLYSQNVNFSYERFQELSKLKTIALKIIEYIAIFENEIKKIWEKPRIIKNLNYVISQDKLYKLGLLEKFILHEGIQKQINEWKKYGIVSNNFTIKDINKYKFLPFDTKYFKDLEIEFLSQIDNLDSQIDGIAIKSENFQALNTIVNKFKNKIQTIYIDPPFIKENNPEYHYLVNYKNSTWLTLLDNRLEIGKNFLKENGTIFVNTDDSCNFYAKFLLDKNFNKNFINEIIIAYEKPGSGKNRLKNNHNTIFFYSKNKEYKYNILYVPRKGEKELTKREGRFATEYAGKISSDWWNDFFWDDIPSFATAMSAKERTIKNLGISFATQQPEKILYRIFKIATNYNNTILDFFAGSGTSVAVAHKMRRKWIAIEMGKQFYEIIIPRLKKVIAFDESGISKESEIKQEYNLNKAGGFFKYLELEQYEEILREIKFNSNFNGYKQPFLFDEKIIHKIEIDENNKTAKFKTSSIPEVAEMLSYIKGVNIKKINNDYIIFEDGEKINPQKIPFKYIKPFVIWE